MCGISGFLSSSSNNFLSKDILIKMINTLHHRGPDNRDLWWNSNNFIALGHNRLSILDLSKKGNQPMASSSGRYIISYNGEIYNHNILRKELDHLKKTHWKSNSDTETLLEIVEYYGVNESLNKFKGMFSFALWDNKEKKLTLVRDRFGEKPLYYGWVSGCLLFSSELKAIENLNNFNKTINFKAISSFLRLSYVPSPYTVYKNVFKLSAGEKLEIKNTGVEKFYLQNIPSILGSNDLKLSKWWSPNLEKENKKYTYSQDIEKNISDKIEESVKLQMVSDVENGIFLSGGVDSSLIASFYQKNSSKKIKSFTIGSDNKSMDEASNARDVAKYLGTDHHEIIVKPNEEIDLVHKLNDIYDEPFGDSSKIPTILINQYAKNYVKVCLTGDGGDEIFCGYNRYLYSLRLWKIIKVLKKLKVLNLHKIIKLISVENAFYLEKFLNFFLRGDKGFSLIYEKINKISEGYNYATNLNDLYLTHINSWQIDQKILKDEDSFFLPNSYKFSNDIEDYNLNMQKTDLITYLPDDILCKTDRAAMFSSIENRSPFLDVDIFKEAINLPASMKRSKNTGKVVLKNILKKHIPEKLFNRPKRGFSIPIGEWLKKDLLDWSNDLLDVKNIKKYEFFNLELIEKFWNEHKSGKHQHSKKIWNLLILFSWLRKHNL